MQPAFLHNIRAYHSLILCIFIYECRVVGRSGRTGRAGRAGRVTALVAKRDHVLSKAIQVRGAEISNIKYVSCIADFNRFVVPKGRYQQESSSRSVEFVQAGLRGEFSAFSSLKDLPSYVG